MLNKEVCQRCHFDFFVRKLGWRKESWSRDDDRRWEEERCVLCVASQEYAVASQSILYNAFVDKTPP